MIHSTVGGNDSSWMDPLQSQNTGHKSLDYGFSQLSLSSLGPNRPPALSTSSISSIGEEVNPGASFNNNNNSNNSRTNESNNCYPPPSPIAPASPAMSHTLNSPTIFRHDSYESRPASANNQGGNQKPLEYNRARSRSQPNAYGVLRSSPSATTSEPIWSPRQLVQDKGNIRSVNSDLSDDMGLGNWSQNNDNVIVSPSSIHRSAHSLQNMGSVDENEQFLGNRGRALSAGNKLHSFQNNYTSDYNHSTSPTFNARDRSSISQRLFVETSSQQMSTGKLFQSQTNGRQPITRVGMFDPRNQIHPDINEHDFFSPTNNPHYRNRQRVMSADAVAYNRYASSPRIAAHDRKNPSPTMNENRPSSAGSGSPYIDVPISMKFFPQVYTNDNRFPSLPPMHLNGMSEEEYSMRMNMPVPPTRHVSEPTAYYQSHGVIAGAPARVIYTVKFKRSQRNFVLSAHILGDIKIGTFVKVEADRGEDLGIVLSRVPAEKFNLNSRLGRYGNSDPLMSNSLPEMKKILSVATNEEITLLRIKQEEEDELLKICRGKTEQRGLPMNVVDAEYQFDRHKLTFFFEAEGRIDFRELVRELFSIYKTRIWMQQIDKNSVGSSCNNLAVATSATCEASNEYL